MEFRDGGGHILGSREYASHAYAAAAAADLLSSFYTRNNKFSGLLPSTLYYVERRVSRLEIVVDIKKVHREKIKKRVDVREGDYIHVVFTAAAPQC